MNDDDTNEKGAKLLLRRRARSQQFSILLCAGLVLTMVAVILVKLHHSPKTRGAARAELKKLQRQQQLQQQHRQEQQETAEEEGDDKDEILGELLLQQQLPANSIYRLSVLDADGAWQSLHSYAGQVTLVVNTACKCGKTETDFTQLVDLQNRFNKNNQQHGDTTGFSVLAFPISDFHQEFSTNEEIQSFLEESFQVNFPVFGMTQLSDNPVFAQLQEHIPDRHVQHNFFKYLVDTNGIAVELFTKQQDPIELVDDIERLLEAAHRTAILDANSR